MRIRKIRVENLFSYDEVELALPLDLAVIVGPNNAGKTNIVRTLDFLKRCFGDNRPSLEELEGILHDPNKPRAKVEVDVELNEKEISYIREFVSLHLAPGIENAQNDKIKFYLTDREKLRKKGFDISRLDEELENEKIQERLNSLFLQELAQFQEAFPEQFGEVRVVWRYEGESRVPRPFFVIKIKSKNLESAGKGESKHCGEIYINDSAIRHPSYVGSSRRDSLLRDMEDSFVSYLVMSMGDRSSNLDEILQKAENKENKKAENTLQDRRREDFIWGHLLYTLSLHKSQLSVSHSSLPDEQKWKARKMYRELGWDELRTYSLWDLLKQIFTSSIIWLGEIRGLPLEEEYKPAIEYDGSGENLASFLHALKESSDPRLREIKERFKDIFGLSFDTERRPFEAKNKVEQERKAPKLFIIDEKRRKKFPITAVGSGVFEVLNLISTIAGSEGRVIILDEPALHLHPVQQKRVLQALKELSGMNNQIILITHSPYFVDSETLEKTYRFYMDDQGRTKVVVIKDALENLELKDELKMIKDSSLIRALFASGVIIAEGDSEYLSVPILARKLGYPLEDYNIEIINAGGDGNIKSIIKIIERLRIPFRVICDRKAEPKIPSQYHDKVFACPADDWKDYLEDLFGKEGGGKIEAVWKIANRVSEDDVKEKMKDPEKFEEFIRKFLEELGYRV
ncbi:AAA family ATPase [Pyrococcus kukulkanii]|uniref:AAA family ATPase n=1 Tax=Pyrococcus kukulkanii TaxID=1609559 RepID=UPI003561F1E6